MLSPHARLYVPIITQQLLHSGEMVFDKCAECPKSLNPYVFFVI